MKKQCLNTCSSHAHPRSHESAAALRRNAPGGSSSWGSLSERLNERLGGRQHEQAVEALLGMFPAVGRASVMEVLAECGGDADRAAIRLLEILAY